MNGSVFAESVKCGKLGDARLRDDAFLAILGSRFGRGLQGSGLFTLCLHSHRELRSKSYYEHTYNNLQYYYQTKIV